MERKMAEMSGAEKDTALQGGAGAQD